jgi:hypothetical protein
MILFKHLWCPQNLLHVKNVNYCKPQDHNQVQQWVLHSVQVKFNLLLTERVSFGIINIKDNVQLEKKDEVK